MNQRATLRNNNTYHGGTIVYWMSREQRYEDNHSLAFAIKLAKKHKQKLYVVFCLQPHFLEATLRQYTFMIEGLKTVEQKLKNVGIAFFLLIGKPPEKLPEFLRQVNAGALITDFDPLRIKQNWIKEIKQLIGIPFYEIDSHNIVPCRLVSEKQEYGAYTIRPKIKKKLVQFLVPFENIKYTPVDYKFNPIDWQSVYSALLVDKSVNPVSDIIPGEDAAIESLQTFINKRLQNYANQRNNPLLDAVSGMSPYMHFGQISAQRIALEVQKANVDVSNKEAYLEELIIRKELADNFCFYNPDYDNENGFHPWAKKTLLEHVNDSREYIYTIDEFENAETHDPLWNAAQRQMIKTGYMHGYLRMYWAKKILEWTNNPAESMTIAIYLNDKYQLDGRDPNGYTGIAWSIGGIHDRAWRERAVYGKIRYMNYNGCMRKFDTKAFEKKF